jgi:hypothetical protein
MKFNRVIALMLAFLMGTIGTIEAKSYSSSRSYKSSPSKSYSSSPKSTKPSSSKYSSSSKKATKPAPMKFKSPKEKASYEKAKKSGTAFSSKSSAQKDFKTKHSAKYKSTYTSKPTIRPDHIPTSTKGANGNTYNVTYNQGGGGYGYTNSLGAFIMYDAMSDAIMMNSLMHRNNYVVNSSHGQHTTVHHTNHGGFGTVFLCIFIGLVIAILIVFGISVFK